jgi:hypothetical protein
LLSDGRTLHETGEQALPTPALLPLGALLWGWQRLSTIALPQVFTRLPPGGGHHLVFVEKQRVDGASDLAFDGGMVWRAVPSEVLRSIHERDPAGNRTWAIYGRLTHGTHLSFQGNCQRYWDHLQSAVACATTEIVESQQICGGIIEQVLGTLVGAKAVGAHEEPPGRITGRYAASAEDEVRERAQHGSSR